jgi:hypothetical protein
MLVDSQELLLELGEEHAKAVACFFSGANKEYDRGRIEGLTCAILAVKGLENKAPGPTDGSGA